MRRIAGWDVALYRVTVAALARLHEWGTHDCVMFGADCVLAMTGEDPVADIRGKYDGPVTAARIIRKAGFDCLGDMIADRFLEIEVSAAGRGDLVLCDGPDGEFVGVVDGHVCLGPAPNGLTHIPLRQAQRAFRVG